MLNEVLLTAAVAVALLGSVTEAHAGYRDSSPVTVYGACPGPVQGVGGQAQVSYWDTGMLLRAGDAIYIRAVVINGCMASGMTVAFQLPMDSFLVEDPSAPVQCFTTKDGVRTQLVDPNQCFALPRTSDLGAEFAQAHLAAWEALEIYVPVRFARTFNGTIGVGARNGIGDMKPTIPFRVAARSVEFFNTTAVPDSSGFNATVSFEMRNYFQGGTLSVEFGETTSFGKTVSAPVAAGIAASSPNVTVPLSNLTPARTYYYRPRMVTLGGETYDGPVQQFTTPPASIAWPPVTTCRRYPCVR